jgi:enoyl-CoA hydratase/carnithine racemase
MENTAVITIERAGHVATVWLDRPEARNAIGQQFFDDLERVVRELDDDPEIRVCVLAARGPDFCVGLDLKNPGPAVGDPSSASGAIGSEQQSRAARAAFV